MKYWTLKQVRISMYLFGTNYNVQYAFFFVHQVCEIMGLCKAPTISSKPVKSLIFEDRTKFSICDSCKNLVNSLRNALTDPANENFVANSLRKICVLIFPNDPTNFANCDTM